MRASSSSSVLLVLRTNTNLKTDISQKIFKMKLALLVILSCFIALTCATHQAKKFVYAKKFEGLPKVSDFSLENETLPELKDGGELFHNNSVIKIFSANHF